MQVNMQVMWHVIQVNMQVMWHVIQDYMQVMWHVMQVHMQVHMQVMCLLICKMAPLKHVHTYASWHLLYVLCHENEITWERWG